VEMQSLEKLSASPVPPLQRQKRESQVREGG
jgi:hypothetical protein